MFVKYIWILLNVSTCCQSILKPLKDESTEINLAECIINIWKIYFNEDLPVFIQTPGTFEHPRHRFAEFGQKFIQILHSQNEFPQITFDASEGNTHKRDKPILEKSGTYIVLLPVVQNMYDFKFVTAMLLTMLHNGHSPKSRVVVIAVEKTRRRVREPASFHFLFGLLRYGFTQVILLEHKNGNGKNIDVYSWFIEDQTNICSEYINSIIHIDTWLPQEKRFLQNTQLFRSSQITNLRGCVLKVYFAFSAPFSLPCKNGVCGIFHPIFKILKNVINFNFVTKAKELDEYDMVFPFIHEAVYTKFDCLMTYPLYYFDMRWLVPSSLYVPRWKVLFYTFDYSIWTLVVLTFSCGSFTMWLLQKSSNHSSENSNEGVIISALLTHLETGVGDKYKGSISAVFFLLWLYYCMIINTAYQSQFFDLLVHPMEMPEMKTIKEVEQSGLILERTINSSFLEEDSYISFIKKYKLCKQNDSCWAGLYQKRTHAILSDTFSGKLFLHRRRNDKEKPSAAILPEGVGTLYLSVGVRKWSLSCALQEAMDRILHRLMDAGFISRSHTLHPWYLMFRQTKSNERPPFAFSLADLQSAFYLLILGILFSSSAFIIEKIIFYLRCRFCLQRIVSILKYSGSF
ncbi:Ionotropic receptor 348 [Blattella germanica]|nr:Ionotropic receptor 348 [Blattella germanica]